MECSRLYVLGPDDTEKTALVRILLGEDFREQGSPLFSSSRSSSLSSLYSSSSTTLSSHAQVNVHRWKTAVDESGVSLAVDVWDVPANQILRGANLLYMTRPCTVLLVTSVHHQVAEVMTILTSVVNKFPDVQVSLAVTTRAQRPDSDPDDSRNTTNILSQAVTDWLNTRKSALELFIQEIKATLSTISASQTNQTIQTGGKRKHQPDVQTLLSELTCPVEEILTTKILLTQHVLTVNIDTHEGLSYLRQEVMKSLTLPGNGGRPETLPLPPLPPPISQHSVCGLLLEMSDSGLVLIPKTDFVTHLRDKLISQCGKQWKETHLEEIFRYLISSGQILEFPLTREIGCLTPEPARIIRQGSAPARKASNTKKDISAGDGSLSTSGEHAQSYICVDLESFANMIGACIVDDSKTTFRLEAGKFWPPESGFQAPDPSSLARVLEEIPGHGVIREAVLPLLWQEFDLSSDQILHCVTLFQHLGVFTDHQTAQTDIAGLAMPDYLTLSAVRAYRFTPLDLMPNTKPQLNWTSRPYKGDLQVRWKLQALTTPPVSVLRRGLAVMRWSTRHVCLYTHMWQDGILNKFDEVNICTELTETGVEVTCRVNGDEPGLEDEAVLTLWTHLVPVLMVLETFLQDELPGAVFKTSISLHGDVFFNMTPTPQDVDLSLEKCLLARHTSGSHVIVPYLEDTRLLDLDILFPFRGEDAKVIWTPTDLKSFVMKKREVIMEGQSSSQYRLKHSTTDHKVKVTRTRSRQQASKKKVSSVSWKSNIAEDLESSSSNIPQKVQSDGVSRHSQPPSELPVKPDISQPLPNPETLISNNAEAIETTTTAGVSVEGLLRERKQLAARFVSAMLAAGVVQYMTNCCSSDADGGAGVLTTAQMSAAQATVQAALAVHTGQLDGAAFAVLDAVRAAHASGGFNRSRGSRSSQGKSSKTCAVL